MKLYRFLSVLTACVLALTLCACAGNSETPSEPEDAHVTADILPESMPETPDDADVPDVDEEPPADTEEDDRPVADSDGETIVLYVPSDLSGVSMATEFASYPIGTNMVTLIITNDGEDTVSMGARFEVEMLDGDLWREPDHEGSVVTDSLSIEYVVRPGESIDVDAYLMPHVYDYTPGRYRLVYYKYDDGRYVPSELTAEFDLE